MLMISVNHIMSEIDTSFFVGLTLGCIMGIVIYHTVHILT